MGQQDEGVAVIRHRPLGVLLEEELRLAHEVLIDGIVVGHQHGAALGAAPPRAAGLLPGARNCGRQSDQDGRIETAYVDAHFRLLPAALAIPLYLPHA